MGHLYKTVLYNVKKKSLKMMYWGEALSPTSCKSLTGLPEHVSKHGSSFSILSQALRLTAAPADDLTANERS